MIRYTFRRYRDGQLKAQRAVVDAMSLAEAERKVRHLGGLCQCEAYKWATDTFELAHAEVLRTAGQQEGAQ